MLCGGGNPGPTGYSGLLVSVFAMCWYNVSRACFMVEEPLWASGFNTKCNLELWVSVFTNDTSVACSNRSAMVTRRATQGCRTQSLRRTSLASAERALWWWSLRGFLASIRCVLGQGFRLHDVRIASTVSATWRGGSIYSGYAVH